MDKNLSRKQHPFSSFRCQHKLENWSKSLKVVSKWQAQWRPSPCKVYKFSFKFFAKLTNTTSQAKVTKAFVWDFAQEWNSHTEFELGCIHTSWENAICSLTFLLLPLWPSKQFTVTKTGIQKWSSTEVNITQKSEKPRFTQPPRKTNDSIRQGRLHNRHMSFHASPKPLRPSICQRAC